MANTLKRKNVASQPQRPSKRAHLVEDDADQNISDDGEVPVYNSADEDDDSGDGSESGDMEVDDDNAAQTNAPVEGVRPPETHSMWKAPTTEELHQLKEATELFKSSAFKLKIDALIPQVKPKQTSAQLLEPLLHALHQHIGSISPLPPQHPLQAARKLRKKNGVQVLYTTPQPRDDTNWKVSFDKPSNIQIVGSWAHQMSIIGRDGLGFSVDLNVEMPSSLFQEKDYLDSRFFHKRSYYLAVIASSLVSSDLGLDVQYDLPDQNPRRSVLVVRSRKGEKYDLKKINASVRIILTLSLDSPISLSRLSPSHANIRLTDPSAPSTTPPQPTPLYNNDILRCMTPTAHLLLMYTAAKEITHFKEATALLRVWANQRGYGKGNKTVVGFEALGSWWGFVLAYLVWGDDEESHKNVGAKKKKGRKPIGKGLSSYQMLRAVMDFFASHDFVEDAVRVRTISGPKPSHFDFTSTSIPVFAGPSTVFNFLSGIPVGSLELLRHDARLTLQALDSPSSADTFELAFMRDLRDMQVRFDIVIRLDLSRAVLTEPVVDHGARNGAVISRLDKILKQALGSRAKIIALVQTPSKPFLSTQSQPAEPTVIEIGLVLDPDNAPRLVDHGPPAEDLEACERFREFWGEKSELRRFNDGRIVESVVWALTGKSTGERLQIPGRMVRFIVGRHLQIPSEDVTVFNSQYDSVLSIPPDIAGQYTTVAPGTAPEAVQRLIVSAYDGFVKDIKVMENIPLALVTSSPVSDTLRYTAVFPTLPLDVDAYPLLPDCAKYLPVTEMVLQFERSSQWPDDLAAIQKVKIALLEAIAQVLCTGGSKASVALDRNCDPIEDHVSLEAILPSGFAFRARIYHDREQTLLERLIADRSTPEYKRKHSQKALDHHLKRFVHAPRHHAALHALHHRYPSYSHTTRLVKRWLNAHWLAPHISPEAMELLCAHVYLNTGVYEPPSTGVSGFSRVVALLAEWDWRESPLLVPVYTSASVVDRTHRVLFPPDTFNQAQERFTKHRAVDPRFSRGAWTIVTEEDLSGHIWSDSVDSIVAGRAKDLAKATFAYLCKGMDSGELDVKTLLLHPTNDYDFLIHLDPSVVPRYVENLHVTPNVWKSATKYANVRADTTSVYGADPRIQFDPVQIFFQDIQRVYGDNLVLFYDPMGGVTMGGVWNPLLRNPRPFRVLLGFSSKPVDSGGKDNKKLNVVLNESAILAEIQRLGKGLIEKVVVQGSIGHNSLGKL